MRNRLLKNKNQTLCVCRAFARQLLFIISYSKPACKIQIVKKRRFPINIAKTTHGAV